MPEWWWVSIVGVLVLTLVVGFSVRWWVQFLPPMGKVVARAIAIATEKVGIDIGKDNRVQAIGGVPGVVSRIVLFFHVEPILQEFFSDVEDATIVTVMMNSFLMLAYVVFAAQQQAPANLHSIAIVAGGIIEFGALFYVLLSTVQVRKSVMKVKNVL